MTDPNFTQDSVLTPEYVRQKIEIRHQEDGGTKQTYQDASGKITSAVYHLYPGITLIRKNVHRPHFISNWRNKPERGGDILMTGGGALNVGIHRMFKAN